MTAEVDFGEVARRLNDQIAQVATRLLGNPTSRTATELRFGERGGISIAIGGAERGLWHDFRDDSGGDAIDLVCHVEDVDKSRALDWACTFLHIERPKAKGNGSSNDGSDAGPDPSADKTARRDAIIKATIAAKGTPVEAYLTGRGITAAAIDLPAIGWNPRAWSGPEGNYGAIVFRATDDAGRVQALQQAYIGIDGHKAPLDVPKRTNGPLGGRCGALPW